jgi:SAM-dependent methyltransferase
MIAANFEKPIRVTVWSTLKEDASRSRRFLIIRYIHDKMLNASAAKYFRGRLIDIGCGEKQYRRLLAPYVIEHVGVDHPETLHDKSQTDLFGSAYEIPAEDCSFDSAVCTAVLEHLEEPEQALRECARILKPGACAIYSVPFIWHLHEEPRDFFRYSKHGLEYLFEKVGFEVIRLDALAGFWVTFGVLLTYYLEQFNRRPIRWLRIFEMFSFVLQMICYGLDRLDKAEKWTWMYMVVARKRDSGT